MNFKFKHGSKADYKCSGDYAISIRSSYFVVSLFEMISSIGSVN